MRPIEAYVLDTDFVTIGVLDAFESFIWTVKYCGYGEFEIYMPVTLPVLQYLVPNNYLITRDSDRIMVIETIEIKTDAENGNHLIVRGRTLESFLERRIIWRHTYYKGNFQNGIKKLLNENAISPSNAKRKIPNLVFKASEDERITSLTMTIELHGENLYEAIFSLCDEKGVGFKITRDDETGELIFELYAGEDRSFEQDKNPWVVFSSKLENLMGSDFLRSYVNYKTVSLVGGEGEGYGRRTLETYVDDPGEGLDRREMFTDAASISSSTSDGEISTTEYNELLREKGLEALSDVSATTAFEGQIDATRQYIFGRDFDLGDIVQVINEYGFEAQSYVSEVMIYQDQSGLAMVPTFVAINSVY